MARGVLELLEEINGNGTTIVMVTHDPELANRAGRQIHVLDGRLIDMQADEPHPLVSLPTAPGGTARPAAS